MLMSAHDGAVDHRIFIVSLCGEVLEHAFPNAGDGPAAEASLHLDPIPKTLRQITPGNPGPIAVEHSFDKHPVVPRRHTNRSRTARQKVSDPLPLIVTQPVASHRSAPNTLTDSESKFVTPWNPQMTTPHSSAQCAGRSAKRLPLRLPLCLGRRHLSIPVGSRQVHPGSSLCT